MKRGARLGVIGGGMMGRELASAVARWIHLSEPAVKPEITAVCSPSPASREWFETRCPTLRQSTADYRGLLANEDVDVVYIAVPHRLHEEIYCAAAEAGKDIFGEKPFGVDLAANEAILRALARRPEVFARCSSQFPFFPAMQAIGRMIERGEIGRVIEIETEFLHASDLDPAKRTNWKRQRSHCGEYGCMGDLGMHCCHVPLRAQWRPRNARAILRDLVSERPDAAGKMVPCDTWDNATILVEAEDAQFGDRFPWTMRAHRVAPGEQNSWNFAVYGTARSARFSTKRPKTLETMRTVDGRQAWLEIDMGHETAFKTITPEILEFGFCDAVLQMAAAFFWERAGLPLPGRFAGCATPAETNIHHRLLTAAIESHKTGRTIEV